MRRFLLGLAIVAVVGVIPSRAMANDDQVAKLIVSKLQAQKEAGRLKDFQLGVRVEDGVAIVDGHVPSSDQQTVALEIVRRVRGVKMVVNDIKIKPSLAMKKQEVAMKKEEVARPQTSIAPLSPSPNDTASSEERAAAAEEDLDMGVMQSSLQESLDTEARDDQTKSVLASARTPMPVARPAALSRSMPAPAVEAAAAPEPVPAYQPAPSPRAAAYQANQTPVPFARSQMVSPNAIRPVANLQPVAQGGPAPIPAHVPGTGMGVAPAQYDHPQLPNYAWPSYAASPNYAAVTYPRQYSPTAWPYIGPFYPYPQVPLGWRKVTLEWDDGWWMLDFKNRHHR